MRQLGEDTTARATRVPRGAVPSSERGSETLELVIRTSTDLFAERGYHGTSMRQLAERGELQPSAFYYYFPSKYDVLLAIINKATTLLEGAAATVPQELPPEQRLVRLIEGHVRVHLTERALTRVCDRELRVLEGAELALELERLSAYEQLFRDTLQDGVRAGVFAAELDVPVAAMSILLMATGANEWWQPSGSLSVDNAAAMIAGFGLSVARGGAPGVAVV